MSEPLENGGFQVGSVGWFGFQAKRVAELREVSEAEAAARMYLVCSEYYRKLCPED